MREKQEPGPLLSQLTLVQGRGQTKHHAEAGRMPHFILSTALGWQVQVLSPLYYGRENEALRSQVTSLKPHSHKQPNHRALVLSEGDFTSREHVTLFGDIFHVITGGLQLGKGQAYYRVQDSFEQQRITLP